MQISSLHNLCETILEQYQSNSSDNREIIAIAGPPASGKSTLMTGLVKALSQHLGSEQVIGIPMDGFHLDNAQLDLNKTRDVKGAPHTFDVDGLVSLVRRVHNGDSPVYAPEFDRAADLSRNAAIKIEAAHKLVLIEGNYLLLDQPVWRELENYFGLTIFIDVKNEVLQDRLVSRWLHYGFNKDEALEKANGNDLPNAKTVVESSKAANIVFKQENDE